MSTFYSGLGVCSMHFSRDFNHRTPNFLATVIEGFSAGSSVCYPRPFVAMLYQNRMLFEDA